MPTQLFGPEPTRMTGAVTRVKRRPEPTRAGECPPQCRRCAVRSSRSTSLDRRRAAECRLRSHVGVPARGAGCRGCRGGRGGALWIPAGPPRVPPEASRAAARRGGAWDILFRMNTSVIRMNITAVHVPEASPWMTQVRTGCGVIALSVSLSESTTSLLGRISSRTCNEQSRVPSLLCV